MEKSLIPRKKQKQGEKTFKFMTFSERIALIQTTFDVVQRQRYVQSTLQHRDLTVDNLHFSYFCDAVSKWRALDNTEEYVTFCRALSLLKVHSYAQVVLLKDQLISLILEHMSIAETPVLSTLCDLLAELAKDLQDEIGTRWSEIVCTLNTQLTACQDPDKVEAVFACLALIIRMLSRAVTKYGLQTILRQFMPLFNSRRQYVQEFAAQSMAFLVRANHRGQDPESSAQVLVEVAVENDSTARAVAFLIFHTVRRSKLSLFSWAPTLLKSLYSYELPVGDKREQQLRKMLLPLTKLLLQHLLEAPLQLTNDEGEKNEKQGEASLSSLRETKIMLAELFLELLRAAATTASLDRANRILLVIETALSYRFGVIFKDSAAQLASVLSAVISILPKLSDIEATAQLPSLLLKCIASVLVPPSTLMASDTHTRRYLISSSICCENIDLNTRLEFSVKLFSMPLFEIETLPYVIKASAAVDIDKWALVVNHFVSIVLKKQGPPNTGRELRDYLSTPFSFSFPKLYDACITAVKSHSLITKSELIQSLLLLPHLTSPMQQKATAEVVHQFFLHTLSTTPVTDSETKLSLSNDNAATVLLLAYLALAQLDRQLAMHCFDAKSLVTILSRSTAMIQTQNNDAAAPCQVANLPALLLADYAVTLSPSILIETASRVQVINSIRQNLTNWCRHRRLLTLRILKSCFNYENLDVDDDARTTAAAGDIFENALIAEAVESNAFNFREKLVCFRRLEYGFVRKASNNDASQIEAAFLFLIGSLHEQFQPLWKPLTEIICSYEQFIQPEKVATAAANARVTNSNLNMPIFLLSLYDNVVDCITRDSADDEVFASFALADQQQQRASSSTTSIKFRQHLLELYAKLSHVFERVPRILVDRFIDFINGEYLPAVKIKNLEGEPAHMMSLTARGDADDDEDADAVDIENDDDVSVSSCRRKLSRSDAETLLIDWLNALAAFPNPGAFYKRNVLAQMFEHLLLSTNTSVQKAALECHLRMPSAPGSEDGGGIDARKVLKKYKPIFDRMLDDKTFRKELVLFSLDSSSSSSSAPNNDTDDEKDDQDNPRPGKRAGKKIKPNSSTSPDDDNRPQTLDAADRASVMPVMLRILTGRLKSKRALGANSTVEAKRRTIVRFVSASASAKEINDFLALSLLPAQKVFEIPSTTTLTKHIKSLLSTYTVDKMFALSQFYAVMSLVRVCAVTLGRLAPKSVVRKIFESSIIMLALCEQFLNNESDRSRIASHFVERLKALRAISYETLSHTLDCQNLKLDESDLLPTLWQYVLWPNSQLFVKDGLVHPTLLMRLCAEKLSKQPKLWPLLFIYDESRVGADADDKIVAQKTVFGELIQLLEYAGSGKVTKKAADTSNAAGLEFLKAQSFQTVLMCVLNLINIADFRTNSGDADADAAAAKNSSPSHLVPALNKYVDRFQLWRFCNVQLSAGHASNAELGSALLVPYADTIMQFMLKQMQKYPIDTISANNKRQQRFKTITESEHVQRGVKRGANNKFKNAENSSRKKNQNGPNSDAFIFTSQHLLLLRRLAQHVTDRASCSSLATLLMLRLDRTPKPRSANALLTTTGRRKRKGPDTLITETVIDAENNLNNPAAEQEQRALSQTEEIFDTLCRLVIRCANPRQFLNQIFQLFASTRHMSARIKVCDLLKSCAEAVREDSNTINSETNSTLLDFIAPLAYELNSYDRRMLNEPDYTQRVEAYKQAVAQFKQIIPEQENGSASADGALPVQKTETSESYYRHRDLVHLILHQACFDLMYTSDLGLREMAKESLRIILTVFLRRISIADSATKSTDFPTVRPKFVGDFVLSLMLPILHTCLRARDDEVRNDFIQILRILVVKCPAGVDANLNSLQGLLDFSNPEHDYFDNLCHIQVHRRLTAIRKATLCIRSGTLIRVPAINQYVLSTALVYLCNAQHVGQTNLHTVCLDLLGAAAQLMTGSYLPIYMSLLKRYATIMMTPVSGSGSSSAVGQQNRLKFQKQAIKIVCKLLDSCPIAVELSTKTSVAKNEAENMEVNDADDSGLEMQSEPPPLPAAVKKLVSLLMPVLASFLALPTGGTRRQQTVADSAETDKLNDMMILKAPITVAVVKLLRKLPDELTDRLLPRIAQALANMLRSRLKSVRGVARECLQEILLTLRHVKFFSVIISQLCSVLTRGYQLHVLTYTVNHLLTNAAVQFMRPGDADEIAAAISGLCRNELFSEVPSEEKNVEKVRQQTFEAEHTTSYSMLTVLMRFMSASRVRSFLLDFLKQAELLASGNSFGGANKVYRHRIEWKSSSTGARVNAGAAMPTPAPSSMLMPGSSSSTAIPVRDSGASAPVGTSLWQYRVVLKKCQVALAQGLALNKGMKHEALLGLVGELCASALMQEEVRKPDENTIDFGTLPAVVLPATLDAQPPLKNPAAARAKLAEKERPDNKRKGGRPAGRSQRPVREPPQIVIAELPVVCKVFVVQLCIQVAAQFIVRNSKLLSKVKDETSKVVKAMNDLTPKILACLEEPTSATTNDTRKPFAAGDAANRASSSANPAVTRHLVEYCPQALAVLTTSLNMSLPCLTADEQRATELLNILLVMLMQHTKNASGSTTALQNELLSGVYSCLTAFIRHGSTVCEQLLLNGEKMDIILSYVEHDLAMASHTRLALELVRACVQQNYDLPALHGEIQTGNGEVIISRYSGNDSKADNAKNKKKRYFEAVAAANGGKKAFLRQQPSLLKSITSSSHAKLEIANSLIKTIAELGVRSVDSTVSSTGTKQLCTNIVSLYLTKYIDNLDAVHSNSIIGDNDKKVSMPLDDDDQHVLMLTKLLRRAYMQFLCSNLQYEYQGGRLAALEMLDALVGNYERSRLAKYNQPSYLFMMLARIISTDDSERCRQLARTVLVHLLQRIGDKERQALFSLATNWLNFSGAENSADEDAGAPLRNLLMKKMAFQVLEVFLDAVQQKDSTETRINVLLPIVQSCLSSDKFAVIVNAAAAEATNTDESQRLADHVLFGCVSVADKLLMRFSTMSSSKRKALADGEPTRNVDAVNRHDVVDCIASVIDLLLHENAMIRQKVMQIALRIVQHTLKFCQKQRDVARRANQYQEALISMFVTSSTNEADENDNVKRLLLDSITVLHSIPEFDAAFRTTLTQLLSAEANLLVLTEQPSLPAEDAEHDATADKSTSTVTFRYFVSRVMRAALEEMATSPKQFSRRSLVLQWLKTLVTSFSSVGDDLKNAIHPHHWAVLLKCSIPILYRCMTNTTVTDISAAVQVPPDARELADFVGAKLRQQVGVDAYTAAVQHVQQSMRKAKAERKQRATALALTRPEKAAQLKIKKQLQKRDSKKRKNAEMQDMRESGFVISSKSITNATSSNKASIGKKKKRRTD